MCSSKYQTCTLIGIKYGKLFIYFFQQIYAQCLAQKCVQYTNGKSQDLAKVSNSDTVFMAPNVNSTTVDRAMYLVVDWD